MQGEVWSHVLCANSLFEDKFKLKHPTFGQTFQRGFIVFRLIATCDWIIKPMQCVKFALNFLLRVLSDLVVLITLVGIFGYQSNETCSYTTLKKSKIYERINVMITFRTSVVQDPISWILALFSFRCIYFTLSEICFVSYKSD